MNTNSGSERSTWLFLPAPSPWGTLDPEGPKFLPEYLLVLCEGPAVELGGSTGEGIESGGPEVEAFDFGGLEVEVAEFGGPEGSDAGFGGLEVGAGGGATGAGGLEGSALLHLRSAALPAA